MTFSISGTAYDYEAGSDETLIKELKNELEKYVKVVKKIDLMKF